MLLPVVPCDRDPSVFPKFLAIDAVRSTDATARKHPPPEELSETSGTGRTGGKLAEGEGFCRYRASQPLRSAFRPPCNLVCHVMTDGTAAFLLASKEAPSC